MGRKSALHVLRSTVEYVCTNHVQRKFQNIYTFDDGPIIPKVEEESNVYEDFYTNVILVYNGFMEKIKMGLKK